MSGLHPHVERWGPSLGPVVLDIGGHYGALVVVAPALEGAELEIRRPGEPWSGRHVAVRSRLADSGATHAAVFGSLEAGTYELRLRDDGRRAPERVVVRGGEVTWHHFGAGRPNERSDGLDARGHAAHRGTQNQGREHAHVG